MKKTQLIWLTICLLMAMTSCMVNNVNVQKRKYNKGFYINPVMSSYKTKPFHSTEIVWEEEFKEKEVGEQDSDISETLEIAEISTQETVTENAVNKSRVKRFERKPVQNIISSVGLEYKNSFKQQAEYEPIPSPDDVVDGDDPIIEMAKKANKYFFMGFIPYAGTVFGIMSIVYAIMALRRADESSDPKRVHAMVEWILYFNVIFALIVLILIMFMLSL